MALISTRRSRDFAPEVRSEFLAKYDIHVVGSKIHAEYWIPAEELEAFNDAICGAIEVISVHRA